MVMEATPSPQSVGREFVRQYYTLLNQSPLYLHRFYNNFSSFIHGGLDPNRDSCPAIGQKQIHQKIQALNFQDCHAKINQVDSQMTLGGGVVIQVSGELSNAGHQMRRFTQTFVLAPQAPKKYYVHNDIFRYQDFGYGDEDEEEVESETTNESNREVENEGVRAEVEEDLQQTQAQQLATKNNNVEQHNQTQQGPSLSQQQQMYSMTSRKQIHPALQTVITISGSLGDPSIIVQQREQPALEQYSPESTTQDQFHQENEPEPQQQQQQSSVVKPDDTTDDCERNDVEQSFTTSIPETETEHQVSSQSVSSGPKTYANLVKSSVGAPQISKQSLSPPPIQNQRIDDRVPSHPQSTGGSLPNNTGVAINQHIHRPLGSQQQQSQQQQYRERLPRTIQLQQRDGERRRPGFSDAHQLFLGNVPHNASESELRAVFERYGRVADLRVHSKQNDRTKGPQGQTNPRVPNYGFITFEDSSVVHKVLNDLPIYFPDENGQKLNVEEKKIRPRGEGGRPSLGGDVNMRTMGGQQQQQQRGPGGPGGMMRGNQHGVRGGRGGYNRGGSEGGRGGIRHPGSNSHTQTIPCRR